MDVAQEFEPLYRAARSLPFRGDASEAALVTITRTRGSTFRRAGTSMLVLRDGQMVCELSGGCPQRDIVWRAQQAMESGEPALVSYGRESNYDVMIETGCGGELDVLVEPWRQPEDVAFLDAIHELRTRRLPGTMASLFAREGNALARRPMRLVHGGDAVWTNFDDHDIKERMLADMPTPSRIVTHAETRQVETAGQRYDVLLESLHPPHALVIIGDGASARMLAQLSRQLGWQTTHISTHADAAQHSHGADHVYVSPHALTSEVTLDALTSVVVMTHRIEQDLAYLSPLMETPVRYIGVIGSRERARQIHQALPRTSNRLHVPAGLDVGSETPQEIALAIAAEILATRNGRSGGSLIDTQRSIHP
jgi:xanthine/CO dehydrogenase XdhC/CoxF family maturation factor